MTTNIDRWHTTFYDAPGTVIIENGSMPTGTPIADAKQRRILNYITPETETSSHYFWGVARQWERENAALTEKIRRDVIVTFDQDKVLLEAQQRELDSDPSLEAFLVNIKIDAGPILGRRLLEERLAAEPSHALVLEPSLT